jgi:uncharacterized damage-inducible protein DinB
MARDTLTLYPLSGYPEAVGYALACMEKERERTLEVVSDLSVDALDATPEGCLNSTGTLLYHIAAIELDWLYSEILEQDIPETFFPYFPQDVRDETGQLSIIASEGIAQHIERLAVVRKALLENLKDLDSEEFYRVRSLPPYDVNPAWVLYHLLEHEAKYGEQLAHICRALEL